MSNLAVLDRRCLWLIPAPLIILGVSEGALFKLALTNVAVVQDARASNFTYLVQANAAAIGMLSTFLLMATACIGATGYFVVSAHRRLAPHSFKWVVTTAAIISIVLIVLGHVAKDKKELREDWVVLGSMPQNCRVVEWRDCGEYLLRWMLRSSSTLLIVAATAVVFGTMLALADPAGAPSQAGSTTPQPDARREERREKIAERWLFTGTVVLVTGLAFHQAWAKWIVTVWGAKSLMPVVSAFTTFNGARFSCFMAAYYLPIICWIKLQAGQDPGRGLGTLASMKTAIGILVPFIASLLAPLAASVG